MKRIYLVRHCKASGQERDAKLSEEGMRQAERLADFFSEKEIDFIVSSPFERAISTIQPLSSRLGLTLHTDDRLSERVLSRHNVADWMDQLRESFDDLDRKLPGGESSREAMDRGISVIHALFEREENNMVAVTHGNLFSLILKYYDDSIGFEDWRALANPDVFELCKQEQSGEVSIKHLEVLSFLEKND